MTENEFYCFLQIVALNFENHTFIRLAALIEAIHLLL